MPHVPPWFSQRDPFILWIEKFIPRKWKQDIKKIGMNQSQALKLDVCTTTSPAFIAFNELMINPLLTSLKQFINHGDLNKAFTVFSSIQLQHITSSSCYDLIIEAISSLLVACSNQKLLPQGSQLHAHIINLGLDQHRLLLPKLVTLYSTFNLFIQAHFIARNSSFRHPLVWNILISSYTKNGLCKEALSTYRKMLDFGIRPDEFTYPSVLKACGEQGDLAFGREVHRSILGSICCGSLCVQNALISMYGKCGEIEFARELFDKLSKRDSFSWNCMISGYASKGMWEDAFVLFEQMRIEGVESNIITWNIIISGCLLTGKYMRALGLLSQMRSNAVNLDAVSIVSGLGACSHTGAILLGKELHGTSVRGGYNNFLNIQNALITMYARCKDHKHAHIVFRHMEDKDVISWNSIISGYAHSDEYEEASFLFREMLLSGFKPNNVTIASILPLCARIANLYHGKELHCYIIKHHEFVDHLPLFNSLVDMYSRTGKITQAKTVFDSMRRKDVVTYTALITGYGILGEGEIALMLFEEMKSNGIKPDHVTMVAVLAACSHSGLVNKGQQLFEQMCSVYGVSPQVEHFACMIDLFGRAGLLNKAEEVIRRMPYKPNADIWATLVGACHIHRNIELGEVAAEKLLAMRPRNSGYYVLIANMFAAAGCWSRLGEVRNLMRGLGLVKPPGCAWVDIGGGFEPFLVGDGSSMELSREIYPLLDGLSEHMKDVGYVSEQVVIDCEVFQE